MGKSVFLLQDAGANFNKVQIRKLRDEIGNGLKLEGPFADEKGRVAEIADQVRHNIMRSGCTDKVSAVFQTLASPSTLLHSFKGDIRQLEHPFEFGPSDWNRERYTAGAVANSRSYEIDGRSVRIVSHEEFFLLTTSILRRLGVDSYFGLAATDESGCTMPFQLSSFSPSWSSFAPVIVVLNDDHTTHQIFSPWDYDPYSSLSLSWVEVPDENALLSIMKLKNAWYYRDTVMTSIRDLTEEGVNDYIYMAMKIGHTLFHGMSLWTLEEAKTDLECVKCMSKTMLNPQDIRNIRSARVSAEHEFVNRITDSERYTDDAVFAMMEHATSSHHKRAINSYLLKKSQRRNIKDLIDAVPKLGDYLYLASAINDHVHSLSKCTSMEKGN